MGSLTYNEAKETFGNKLNICPDCQKFIKENGTVKVLGGNEEAVEIEPQYLEMKDGVHFYLHFGENCFTLCGLNTRGDK